MVKKWAIGILSSIFGLITGIGGHSQNNNSYSFQHIDINDGLANNIVRCVTEDHQGFIWIGTSGGLSRYDAHSIKNYFSEHSNPRSLPSNNISCLLHDSRKNLWIGTFTEGLCRYDPSSDNFERYSYDPKNTNSPGGNTIGGLFEDSRGNIWIGSHPNGITLFNLKTNSFTRIDLSKYLINPTQGRTYSGIAEDHDGIIWLASTSNTLEWYNPDTKQFGSMPIPGIEDKGNQISSASLLVDSDNDLWIGHEAFGLWLYNKKSGKFTRFKQTSDGSGISYFHVKQISEPERGKIWIAIDLGGINIYNKKTSRFEYIRSNINFPNGLAADNVYTVYPDRKGNVWVGIFNNGVDFYAPSRNLFTNYDATPNCSICLTFRTINTLCKTADGCIWIGTDGGGINILDPKTGIIKPFRYNTDPSSILNDKFITAIYSDWTGRIWVAAWSRGICMYDPIKKTARNIVEIKEGFAGSAFYFLQTQPNVLWYGTFNGGAGKIDLSTFKRTTYPANENDPHSVINQNVNCIIQDQYKNVWFGTDDGISILNENTGVFTHSRKGRKSTIEISDNIISSLYKDVRNNIWIGTSSGLNKYNPYNQKTTVFNETDGLPSNLISDIVCDSLGSIWVSTANGIARFDSASQHFIKYQQADGIICNMFSHTACAVDNNNRIYFGGISGITSFNPKNFKAKNEAPKLVFSDFRLFNKSIRPEKDGVLNRIISEADEVNLSYSDNVFSIEFAALDFTNPQKIKYRYRLENFDKDWTTVDANQRLATYTNLPGGTYFFRLQSTNSSDQWCSNDIILKITVNPPFWKTWWFITTLILLGLAALYILYLLRMRIIESQKKQLEKMVTARTNELVIANEEMTNQNEEIKQQRDQIQEQANELELHRNNLEKLINERTIDLIKAKEQAEESDRLKTAFLSNMSHEIRTPMNAINGFLELLTDNNLEQEERKRYTNIVIANSDMLLRLINDILDLSFIESGQMQLNVTPTNVSELFSATRENYQNSSLLVNKPLVKMIFSNPPESLQIFTDEQRLKQVFIKLIDNALKYTEAGNIEIGLWTDKISAVFYIRDTGIGIPSDKLEFIFDRFTKIEGDGARLYRGAGLGLAITRKLVELMNGRIWVESQEHKGSCFFFTQPLAVGNKIRPPIETSKATMPHINTNGRKLILICEDEDSNYIYLERALNRENLTVIRARNGEEAVNIVKSGTQPDLILMDIKMPIMDGIETTYILKNQLGYSKPIIAQTAFATNHEKENFSKYFNAFLTKPILREELIQTLNIFLS